jgi:hypothetical protein
MHLISETTAVSGQHVETRRQHLKLHWEDGEFSVLAFARVASDTNDVTALSAIVDFCES